MSFRPAVAVALALAASGCARTAVRTTQRPVWSDRNVPAGSRALVRDEAVIVRPLPEGARLAVGPLDDRTGDAGAAATVTEAVRRGLGALTVVDPGDASATHRLAGEIWQVDPGSVRLQLRLEAVDPPATLREGPVVARSTDEIPAAVTVFMAPTTRTVRTTRDALGFAPARLVTDVRTRDERVETRSYSFLATAEIGRRLHPDSGTIEPAGFVGWHYDLGQVDHRVLLGLGFATTGIAADEDDDLDGLGAMVLYSVASRIDPLVLAPEIGFGIFSVEPAARDGFRSLDYLFVGMRAGVEVAGLEFSGFLRLGWGEHVQSDIAGRPYYDPGPVAEEDFGPVSLKIGVSVSLGIIPYPEAD